MLPNRSAVLDDIKNNKNDSQYIHVIDSYKESHSTEDIADVSKETLVVKETTERKGKSDKSDRD